MQFSRAELPEIMSSSPKGGGGPKRGGTGPPATPEPPVDRAFLRHQLQLLAWIRVGLGALSGFIAGYLPFEANYGKLPFSTNAYADVYFAVFMYIASYYLAKYGLQIHMPYKDRNKLITQGIGGFIMMFLFVWILYSTFCFSVNMACPHFTL
jgi:hypothetical protein